MLPRRRVIARVPIAFRCRTIGVADVGLEVVGQVRPGIARPVLERHVGQAVRRGIGKGWARRIAGAIRKGAAGVIHIADRLVAVDPDAIGHQQVVAGAAAVFRRLGDPRREGIGIVHVLAAQEVARPDQGGR
ncbi:hypothetical protein D3C81_1831650 [compost metagenome]